MSYKWKPSKTAKRAFADKMANDSQFASDYYGRKSAKAAKKRAGSKFDYNTAGGEYVPTKDQYNAAMSFLQNATLTQEQEQACNIVTSAYSLQDKCHHDHIHIVNALRRAAL